MSSVLFGWLKAETERCVVGRTEEGAEHCTYILYETCHCQLLDPESLNSHVTPVAILELNIAKTQVANNTSTRNEEIAMI